MAINQVSDVVLDKRIDRKQVKYLNKDFSDFKKSLIEFTKFYFSDTYQDFSDASPGSIFLDLSSYIGDVLSYYTDHSFKESLLAHAEEKENIVSLAQGFGYKPRLVTPAFCTVSMSALIPADSEGNLETKYLPRFLPGTSFAVSTQNDVGTFITKDICDFGDATNRDVRPFSLQDTGLPDFYLVSKPIKTISGTEKSIERVITTPTKFLKIEVPGANVVDIKSVVDAEGNTWNQVDNLSQDYIFQDIVASPSSTDVVPFYKLKTIKTNRRFVVRLNRNLKTELIFGGGTGDLSDVYENPDYKSVYDENYLQNMTNVALDTLNFTTGNSFGLAPGNTTLTITYRVAGGVTSNVGSGLINKISNLSTGNETRILSTADQAVYRTMLSSVTVTNDEAASGGGSPPSVEQIRQSAMGYINAQGRIVTSTDYEKRVLSMPAKYGTVHKAFVIKDDAINAVVKYTKEAQQGIESIDPEDDVNYVDNSPINTNINLYVMGLDSNNRLSTINNSVKLNIKQFLKGYRILTERINIVDAFRVSIGINYSIVVYKGSNTTDTLVRCSDTIRKYFNIDDWQINQPIIKDDLLVKIANVDGVQSVTTLTVVNKHQQQDGSDYAIYKYNIAANTKDRVIYPSADPCIFELRYPQTDIVGSAVQ